jgi:hypothetical protein
VLTETDAGTARTLGGRDAPGAAAARAAPGSRHRRRRNCEGDGRRCWRGGVLTHIRRNRSTIARCCPSNGDGRRQRAPRLEHPPNWKNGITETLEWLSDVLRNSYGAEQVRALRLSPRRTFEVTFNPSTRSARSSTCGCTG